MSESTGIAALELTGVPDISPTDEVSVVVGSEVDAATQRVFLVNRMDVLIDRTKTALKEREVSLGIAIKNHWNLTRIKHDITDLKRKKDTYEKLRAAFEQGYVLVPDLNIDVFAIRTNRAKPRRNKRTDEGRWPGGVRDQSSEAPPLEDGKYVSERAVVAAQESTKNVPQRDGTMNPVLTTTQWAKEFREEIDFPFVLSKPRVLAATERAMALKIFDEIGVSPARHERRKDPVVVGRIKYLKGYQSRNFDFLVAWFIPLSMLELR